MVCHNRLFNLGLSEYSVFPPISMASLFEKSACVMRNFSSQLIFKLVDMLLVLLILVVRDVVVVVSASSSERFVFEAVVLLDVGALLVVAAIMPSRVWAYVSVTKGRRCSPLEGVVLVLACCCCCFHERILDKIVSDIRSLVVVTIVIIVVAMVLLLSIAWWLGGGGDAWTIVGL